ncbi:hypothetical protein PVAG01_00556 [Phlyctema vagabunda]|uniref:Anoctamin alpha-beta plait domain-containing protein n=1 Tax=Phlyctema vagabunda TaxID=108571 RepID=A0ABR4PUL0_9HELO
MNDWLQMMDTLEKTVASAKRVRFESVGDCDGEIAVDYVITFRYADMDTGGSQDTLQKLIRTLQNAGLLTEIREGAHSSLLIFVRARDTRLLGEVYRSRIKDWLFGIRTITPERLTLDSLPALTDAERLRNVYYMITRPLEDRGAGITPGRGAWGAVESIFPLHDPTFNGNLIKTWSKKSMLGIDELTVIKDQFGPKVRTDLPSH